MSKTIKGDINIHTKNIFPIIKKWLYSEHDIFVRELISNSFDAINKLKKISSTEKVTAVKDHKIEILTDKEAKTLTFRDTGLGMTAKEVQKYIAQIAFSGAEDFLEKYTSDDNKQDIIGHFGMGFYSSFMVADTVEIKSKSYQNVPGVHWVCKGETEYEMVPIKKENVGTDIILNINKDSEEYLEEIRIENLIKKYANFLPIEISLNGRVINDQNGIWVQSPQDLKDDDYKAFYQKLFPFQEEPLFWIHLNVDYPFRLQGILYFPKVKNELDLQKDRIKLFCQQVFVTDNAHDILPEFLMMLQGVIDCPDFPLNVSRSALQNDPYMQKISKHIIKKIADKISQLFKKDRENYESYWPNIHPFVKYGMMNNDDFYEKTKNALIFETTKGGYTTIENYLENNKDSKTIIYSTNKEIQGHYIDMLTAQGKEILLMDNFIDSHFIQFLEMKDNSIKYSSVDGDAINDILENPEQNDTTTDSESEGEDGKEKKKPDHPIAKIFKTALKNDGLNVAVTSFKSNDTIALIKQDEQSKRMKEMSRMMGNADMMNMFGGGDTLMINENHPTVQKIKSLEGSKDSKTLETLCEHVYDLALIAHGSLDKDKLPKFIKRSQTILEMLN